jgi:hypothetical protein
MAARKAPPATERWPIPVVERRTARSSPPAGARSVIRRLLTAEDWGIMARGDARFERKVAEWTQMAHELDRLANRVDPDRARGVAADVSEVMSLREGDPRRLRWQAAQFRDTAETVVKGLRMLEELRGAGTGSQGETP